MTATEPALQVRIIQGLSPRIAGGVHERLKRAERRAKQFGGPRNPPVVFEEIPLLMAVRLALLEPEAATPVAIRESHERIARAVLACSDHIDDRAFMPPRELLGTPRGDEHVAHFEFLTMLARYDEGALASIGRAYDLLRRRLPAEIEAPRFETLRAELLVAMAGDAQLFWTMLFALQTIQRTIDVENVASTSVLLDVASFSDGHEFAFPREEVERVLALLTRTSDEARLQAKSFEDRISSPGWPFDMSFFFARPLLRFGNHVTAPSARLLYAKLGFGLHHSLYFALPSASLRRQYADRVGTAFEGYVGDLFGRIGQRDAAQTLRASDLERLYTRKKTPKLCDGVLWTGTTLVLWEAKAWTANAAAYSGDFAAFRQWYEELISRCTRQFYSTLREIESGAFEALGIKRSFDSVHFLVVPFVPIPWMPHLSQFAHRIAALACPDRSWTSLQVVAVEALEALEPLVDARAALHRVLDAQVSADAVGVTLNNWCRHMGLEGYGSVHNRHLASAYESLTRELDAVLATRRSSHSAV